jgi:hypothetical protein
MSNRIKFSLIGGLAVLITVWLFSPTEDTINSTMFCAHGKLFIEFEHSGYLWGTMFLDSNGKAIPCTEEPKVPVKTTNQTVI